MADPRFHTYLNGIHCVEGDTVGTVNRNYRYVSATCSSYDTLSMLVPSSNIFVNLYAVCSSQHQV